MWGKKHGKEIKCWGNVVKTRKGLKVNKKKANRKFFENSIKSENKGQNSLKMPSIFTHIA